MMARNISVNESSDGPAAMSAAWQTCKAATECVSVQAAIRTQADVTCAPFMVEGRRHGGLASGGVSMGAPPNLLQHNLRHLPAPKVGRTGC